MRKDWLGLLDKKGGIMKIALTLFCLLFGLTSLSYSEKKKVKKVVKKKAVIEKVVQIEKKIPIREPNYVKRVLPAVR